MPYDKVDAEIFHGFQRLGRIVTVYHVYYNDHIDEGQYSYWYGLTPHASIDEDPMEGGEFPESGLFDIRDLPGSAADHKQRIDEAADAGCFDDWIREHGTHLISITGKEGECPDKN